MPKALGRGARLALLSGVLLASGVPLVFSLHAPFVFDDAPNIVDNADLHLVRIDLESVARAVRGPNLHRPLAYLTFAANHLAGGLDPFGYHLVNLLLHLLVVLFVYLLAARLLEETRPDLPAAERTGGAFFAAALFGLHPIQTAAVAYVVQRMAVLVALFGVAALWLYVQGRRSTGARRRRAFALAVAAFVLALSSKENALVLPLLVLAVEVLLGDLPRWATARPRRALAAAGLVVAAAAAAIASLWPWLATLYQTKPYTVVERLMTQPRVLFHYLSLLLWPWPGRFHLDYDTPVSRSLFAPPTTLLAVLGLAALVTVAVRSVRARPFLAFAIAWYLLAQVAESTIVPLSMTFEHRVYLPSVGLCIAAGAAFALHSRRLGAARLVLAAIVLLLLAASGIARNLQFNDPAALYADAVREHPTNARMLLNVGEAALLAGDLDRAETALIGVLDLEPANVGALVDLGVVAERRGAPDAAERQFRLAGRLDPTVVEAGAGLVRVLLAQNRPDDALGDAEALCNTQPGSALAHVTRAQVLLRLERDQDAGRAVDRALAIDPGSSLALATRAQLNAKRGDSAAALADSRTAARLDPDNPDAWMALGRWSERFGRPADADQAFSRALALSPRLRGAHFSKAMLAIDRRDFEGAEAELTAELAIAPHAAALNNLGNIALTRGDRSAAGRLYLQALAVDPNNREAALNLSRLQGLRR
ncbi:MAG: tetratricopeptide repeat protein [Deltaproteobacteria bacterium]|nr:tetratricopeptide repeat protein [Deltaproteobacteria bacterium]